MEIEWIFFDCFNTLIDDFDQEGDESGMKPVAHLPVEYGLYQSPSDFHREYIRWRLSYWKDGRQDEVHLQDRLKLILGTSSVVRTNDAIIDKIVTEMMESFHRLYPKTVRLTPGVRSVLDCLDGKVKMGVISNFFLPGYPASLLESNGLDSYFRFIVDSAQTGFKKPGKKIYQKAMHMAGLKETEAKKILFVGDSLRNDVQMPELLGMKAIHFDRSVERGGHITPPGYLKMTRWSEFPALFDQINCPNDD